MDTLIGFFLLVAAAAVAWRIVVATKDPIHPMAVFTFFWIGMFGFGHFRISETYDEPYYADPFELKTYLVVFLAYAAFAFTYAAVANRQRVGSRNRVADGLRTAMARPGLSGVALVLFAVATLTTAYFVRIAGTIPLFSPDLDTLRLTFKLPLWGYLYDLHIPAALFAAVLAYRADSWWLRGFWTLVASASLLMLMFGGVRVSAMTALVWIGIYAVYAKPRVSRRFAVVSLVAAVTVAVTVENARRRQFRDNPSFVNTRIDASPLATVWAHSGASYKNLQLLLDGESPLNAGMTSYDLPKTIIPSGRAVDADISHRFGTHNTPTFLGLLYFDFGLAGLVIMPGLYGAIMAWVYGWFRARANIFWLLIYIDFFLAVLLSFRTHRFFGNGLIFFAGVAFLIEVLLSTSARDQDSLSPVETTNPQPRPT